MTEKIIHRSLLSF